MTVLKKLCMHNKGENHLLEAVLPFYKLKVTLVIGRTGVFRKDLAEVVVARCRHSTQSSVRDIQQGAIFLVLPEVVLAARNVVALLPDAITIEVGDAVERIEDGRLRQTTWAGIIGRRYQSTALTSEAVADRRIFDARQVCFESGTAIVDVVIRTG